MIALLDVCPSYRERRWSLKTFARHGKDICPSRRLPVGDRLPVCMFDRQSFARHVKDVSPSRRKKCRMLEREKYYI